MFCVRLVTVVTDSGRIYQYVVFLQYYLLLPGVVPREGGQRGGGRGGRLAHCAPGTLPGVAGIVQGVPTGKRKHCWGYCDRFHVLPTLFKAYRATAN